MHWTNEKTYVSAPERLRRSERVAWIKPEAVVRDCTKGQDFHSVLDVGTGTGLFAEQFVNAGLRVTGADRNPEYLEEARRLVPSASFMLADMNGLAFRPDSFDLVFFGHVFHETDHHAKVLSDCRRIARKAVCILEWPYKEEAEGPPLHHRIKPGFVSGLARKTGFSSIRTIRQSQMILYRLER